MSLWRKKPVVIEALKWNGTTEHATTIIDWILKNGGTARFHDGPEQDYIAIDTLEGTMTAGVGWWIIKGVQDEFYPCKPDIFEATYERADD